MAPGIAESWGKFRQVLQLYREVQLVLNPPCSTEQIREVETQLGFEIPSALKVLLAINNGQRVNDDGVKEGIFKSLSGWDVYERHIFLGVEDIQIAYTTFVDDPVLRSEFGISEIPFAISGSPSGYREAFCIHRSTGVVSLIWTEYSDPFNFAKWQVEKFTRAESLAEFILKQIALYR